MTYRLIGKGDLIPGRPSPARMTEGNLQTLMAGDQYQNLANGVGSDQVLGAVYLNGRQAVAVYGSTAAWFSWDDTQGRGIRKQGAVTFDPPFTDQSRVKGVLVSSGLAAFLYAAGTNRLLIVDEGYRNAVATDTGEVCVLDAYANQGQIIAVGGRLLLCSNTDPTNVTLWTIDRSVDSRTHKARNTCTKVSTLGIGASDVRGTALGVNPGETQNGRVVMTGVAIDNSRVLLFGRQASGINTYYWCRVLNVDTGALGAEFQPYINQQSGPPNGTSVSEYIPDIGGDNIGTTSELTLDVYSAASFLRRTYATSEGRRFLCVMSRTARYHLGTLPGIRFFSVGVDEADNSISSFSLDTLRQVGTAGDYSPQNSYIYDDWTVSPDGTMTVLNGFGGGGANPLTNRAARSFPQVLVPGQCGRGYGIGIIAANSPRLFDTSNITGADWSTATFPVASPPPKSPPYLPPTRAYMGIAAVGTNARLFRVYHPNQVKRYTMTGFHKNQGANFEDYLARSWPTRNVQ